MNINLSTYRLGDLFYVNLKREEIDCFIEDHPGSIASDFLSTPADRLATDSPNPPLGWSESNLKTLTDITLNHIEKYRSILPEDIEQATVVHLRLGDVVAGVTNHEKSKRPIDLSYYDQFYGDNLYVIGKCFFANTSSTNYSECINLSNSYLESVIQKLNAKYFDGGNADIDFCCGVLSKKFVQGKGYFSKLIVDVRKEIGKTNNIETEPSDLKILFS